MSRPRLRSDVSKETIQTDLNPTTMAEPEPEKVLHQIKSDDASTIKKPDQELIPHNEMENRTQPRMYQSRILTLWRT